MMNRFRNWKTRLVGLMLAAAAAAVFNAPGFASGPASSLNNYGVRLFGEIVGPNPIQFMKLENNGEILVACVPGKTIEQLKAEGITCQSNQIKLLMQHRLLQSDGDVLTTAFPIMTPEQTRAVRAITKDQGYKLGHKIHQDLRELKEKLQKAKRLKSHYSILYSYILDDLVWRRLKDKHHIQDYQAKATTPTWSGRIWAVFPPVQNSYQTKTFSYQGLELKVIWNEDALPRLEPVWKDKKTIDQLLAGYKKLGKISDPQARKVLHPYNLFEEDGSITLPLIVEKRGDPLYERCVPIARSIADYVTEEIDLDGIQDQLGLPDREITLLIVYHELVWDMLKYLETQGLTEKPEVFAFPQRAQPGDVGDLMFLVSRERLRRR